MAIKTPSSMPSTKPSTVADSVTPAWNTRLRGLSMSASNTLCHQFSATWCGAGSTGRSIDQVAATSSRAPQGAPDPSSRSITCGALSHTAIAYHTSSSAATTSATGAARRTGSLIAVAGAQRHAHLVGDGGELGRLAHVELARGRQPVVDHLEDAPRARTHHHDAVGQEHRLGDRVRHEDHRLAGALPQPQQLLVESVAGDL